MQKLMKAYSIFYILCSSLVKLVSEWENNFMQNKYNKWMMYRNIIPRHKNTNLGLSTINLVGADMIEIVNSILIIETYLCMIYKHINGGQFAVETLVSSSTWFRHANSIINDN